VQVPYQPNEARLVGADTKQSRDHIRLYYRHLNRACGVEFVFVHLAAYLDLVDANVVHMLAPSSMDTAYHNTKQRTSHKDVICAGKKM
jgi:hypothetical protein